MPGGRIDRWPWSRRWLSRWGNRYAAGVLGLAVNDATAGYRAYRCDALQRMNFDTVTADGYGFQIEMTHRLVRAGGKIVEFPIAFRDRGAGSPSSTGASCVRRSGWSCDCGSTTAATAAVGDASPADTGSDLTP